RGEQPVLPDGEQLRLRRVRPRELGDGDGRAVVGDVLRVLETLRVRPVHLVEEEAPVVQGRAEQSTDQVGSDGATARRHPGLVVEVRAPVDEQLLARFVYSVVAAPD